MKDCIEATSQIPRPQLKLLFSCTGHLSAATPLISFPPSLSFLGLPKLSSLLPHHPLKARAYWGPSVWPSSCLEEFLALSAGSGLRNGPEAGRGVSKREKRCCSSWRWKQWE